MRQTKKGITIRGLAEKAGCSVTTISHALHGKGRVSSETQERITRLAEEHGYMPDFFAARLGQDPRPYIYAEALLALLERCASELPEGALREEALSFTAICKGRNLNHEDSQFFTLPSGFRGKAIRVYEDATGTLEASYIDLRGGE